MRGRVLLLITDLQIGGTPTVVRELAVRLARLLDVKVEVACLAEMGPVGQQLEAMGVPVTALGARGPGSAISTLSALVDLIQSRQFDTVFSFLIHANALAAASSLMTWRRGVRYIQSIQTTQPRPRWHWALQRLIHRRCQTIVVPSASVAQVARQRSGIPAGKFVVIPNAIDVDAFQVTPAPHAGLFSVGFIGRLDPVKRIPDLLAAVARLEGVHLHIYGSGRDRACIEREVERLRLEGRVTLHGTIDRPQEALRHLDVLVLPSEAEGFGLVLIEAMAAGVAVVGTDTWGIRDVSRHGETGLLVPVGSPDALVKAIARLRDEPALRRRLIDHARRDVHARFTWPAVFGQYRALLRV
jgi:glycosyltransferase involved in cell wall biosynthesis